MKKTVIVIFGEAQHGKDSLADFLCKELNGARRLSFATPVKEVAKILLNMPDSVAYGGQVARTSWSAYGKNGREWLQWVGTELGREQISAEIWIDQVINTINNPTEKHEFVIITDGRFKNEYFSIQKKLMGKHDFVPIKIYRPGVSINSTHASEQDTKKMPEDMFRFSVKNDAALENLALVAKHIKKHILNAKRVQKESSGQ